MGKSAPSLDTPLVLVAFEGRRRIVTAADMAARRHGLHAGMPASKAQALVAGLTVMDADRAADAAALGRLALWMQRHYSPLVSDDLPNGLMLDITGGAHLFGGEMPFSRELVQRLAEVGISARVAVAPSYGAAHALARYVASPTFILSDGEVEKAISLLPVAALRLPDEMVGALKQLGFERIGELNSTPRAPLALRFGAIIGKRLDQAHGRAGEPFDPVIAPEVPHVRRAFAEPIAAPETLARYTGQLVETLSEKLEKKGLGARKIDLLFYRVDKRIEVIRIGTAQPVRDSKHLTKLLCDKLETVDPGFGVEAMTLAAFVVEPLAYRASPSSLVDAPDADVSALIDTLANRLGEDKLFRLAPVESDVPERAVKRVAALSPATGKTWPRHWPRPLRLLDPPERVETVALLPDHPPAAFTWRGRRRRVSRADGPERLFGEWWRSEAELSAVRDYFQVEDDAGERFWLFRAGDGEDPRTGSQSWFMHGIFA